MGDVSNPPPGNLIPEAFRWKEPAPKPVSEKERQATEEHLRNLNAMGVALGADFDVEGEMAKRGLKTGAQIEEERAKAERDAEIAARETREINESKAHNRAIDDAAGDAEILAGMDKSLGKFKRKIEKTIRKLR